MESNSILLGYALGVISTSLVFVFKKLRDIEREKRQLKQAIKKLDQESKRLKANLKTCK